LSRKRVEYASSIPPLLTCSEEEKEEITLSTSHSLLGHNHQIDLDLPRTSPDLPLVHQEPVQKALGRILLTYACRHPATGYVQGMNDLLVPIFAVILSQYSPSKKEVWSTDIFSIEEDILREVEADSYWCLASLLDKIQVFSFF